MLFDQEQVFLGLFAVIVLMLLALAIVVLVVAPVVFLVHGVSPDEDSFRDVLANVGFCAVATYVIVLGALVVMLVFEAIGTLVEMFFL